MTNCYIVRIVGEEVIIDPGMDATAWVLEQVKNPVAILNTHGHFDHVWSNAELKDALKIPLVAPVGDTKMLQTDHSGQGMTPSTPDIEVEGDRELTFGGITVRYLHFPGHTPGCSVIEIEDAMFSGDFIFKGTIGRYDFPYSSAEAMRASIAKFMEIPYDKTVYPGHEGSTTIAKEQNNLRRIRL